MTDKEQADNFLEFQKQLEKITQNTSHEARKGIHYKTLRNFVYHYNSSKKGKIKTTELLKEYLKLIEEQNYFFTEEQSKAANDFYIGPLAQDFYTRYVNFSSEFALFFQILFCGIPVYISWIMLHSKVTMLLLLAVYFLYYINYFLKYRNKKIYGYRY